MVVSRYFYLFVSLLLFSGCSTKQTECSVIEDNIYFPTSFNYHNIARLRDISFVALHSGAKKEDVSALEEDKIFYGKNSIVYSDSLLYAAVGACDRRAYARFYALSQKAYDIYDTNRKHYLYHFSEVEQKEYVKENKRYLQALFSSTYLLQNHSKNVHTFKAWINHKRTLFSMENAISVLSTNKRLGDEVKWYYAYKQELAKLYQQKRNSSKIAYVKEKITKHYKYIISKSPELKRLLKDIGFGDVKRLIGKDELYIDFAKVGEVYYYFILDSKGKVTFKKFSLRDSIEIDETIVSIQKQTLMILEGQTFADISSTQEMYGKLYSLLIAPLSLGNIKHLIVSPDSKLNLVPFEAFYNKQKKQYLMENYAIRYTPSAKEFVQLSKKTKHTIKSLALFSEIDFNNVPAISKQHRGSIFRSLKPTFSTLLGAKVETDEISRIYKNKVIAYKNTHASEENLMRLHSPSILHLATHGFFLNDDSIENPLLKSGIVLSGANIAIKQKKGSGIVTALELAGLDLKHTSLVTLSACQTGVGIIEDGEGVAGINQAFMYAGASNVVMSLWSVNDAATAEMMKLFYGYIHEGYTYSNALRKSKLDMLKRNYSHPFYWAGFVCYGKG